MTAWTHEHTQPIPAAPERVYRALTEQGELERWFAEHVRVEARVGGPFRFWGRHTVGTPTEAQADGEIVTLEPGSTLGFRWTMLGVPSTVTLAVASHEGGAAVTVRHDLSGPLDQPRTGALVEDWWRLALGNLTVHATGRGELVRPDFADPRPEVRVSTRVAAPPATVFRALTDPAALRQWMMATEHATVDARVGGTFDLGWRYTVEGREHVVPPQKILELVPNERLTIEWPDWRGDPTVPMQRVTWLLEPAGAGTVVTVIHAGFTRAVDMSDYPFGWGHFNAELARVAATL